MSSHAMGNGRGRSGDAVAQLGQAVAAEATRLLAVRAGADATTVSIEREELGRTRVVYRLRARADGGPRSVVVKRLDPAAALRTRRVACRWLPAIGLEAAAPRLLGAVADDDGESLWHLYEDVGGVPLERRLSVRECVRAAVELIAELHTRAAGLPFLSECRRDGGDLGMHYFDTNVNEALNLLDALRVPAVRHSRQQAGLRDRLRRRLAGLKADAPRRARLMAEVGGPETLLHGDLWTTNVVVVAGSEGLGVKLVDWDNAGAGPICYDISTFLYRFGRAHRSWVLDYYRSAVAPVGWRLPSVQELNVLCDTAECARYANRIIWPAAALLEDGAPWGFIELGEIEGWFDALEPVLDT